MALEEGFSPEQVYRYYSVLTVRGTSIIAMIFDSIFYIVLSCRWRLTEKIHWFMCNFIVSEIVRNLACIIHGVIEINILPVLNRRLPDNMTNADVVNDNMTILDARTVLGGILEVGVFASMVFALITMYYYYKQLKNPFVTERYDKISFAIAAIIWIICILYYAIVVSLRMNMDYFQIMFLVDDSITVIFAVIYIITSIIMFCYVIALFFRKYPTDKYFKITVKLFTKEISVKISILLIMLFAFMLIANMLIFLTSVELQMVGLEMSVSTEIQMARTVVEDLTGLWPSILAILWPFVWLFLDNGLKQETEKFFLWFKQDIPKRNFKGQVFRRLRS